ncbi:unnamed protein product, partial [Discosporangium mesarthrocarpum]
MQGGHIKKTFSLAGISFSKCLLASHASILTSQTRLRSSWKGVEVDNHGEASSAEERGPSPEISRGTLSQEGRKRDLCGVRIGEGCLKQAGVRVAGRKDMQNNRRILDGEHAEESSMVGNAGLRGEGWRRKTKKIKSGRPPRGWARFDRPRHRPTRGCLRPLYLGKEPLYAPSRRVVFAGLGNGV